MGAEPWSVTAPWAADVEQVLTSTRQRVFVEGSYQAVPTRSFATLAELDAFFLRSPEDDDFDEEGDFSEGADGTCSILDIRGVGDERSAGIVAPLPSSVLVSIFGTATPQRDDFSSEQASQIYELLDRGEAHYVVSYDGETPVEITFLGYSWD